MILISELLRRKTNLQTPSSPEKNSGIHLFCHWDNLKTTTTFQQHTNHLFRRSVIPEDKVTFTDKLQRKHSKPKLTQCYWHSPAPTPWPTLKETLFKMLMKHFLQQFKKKKKKNPLKGTPIKKKKKKGSFCERLGIFLKILNKYLILFSG